MKLIIEVEYDNESWPELAEGADLELYLEDAVTGVLVRENVHVFSVTIEHKN